MSEVHIQIDPAGAARTIAAMDQYDRENVGQSALRFVQRVMRDPKYRAMIDQRVEEIRLAREGK